MRDDLDIPFPATGAPQGSPYQPRHARDTGLDPNTRHMAMIAGGIGVALVVLMGAWSVIGRHHTGVPVVMADARPVKARPVNKGGLVVDGADETIMSGATEGASGVAPAPEAPAIAALRAAPAQSTASAPPSVAPSSVAPPSVALPLPTATAALPLNVAPSAAPVAQTPPPLAIPAKPAPLHASLPGPAASSVPMPVVAAAPVASAKPTPAAATKAELKPADQHAAAQVATQAAKPPATPILAAPTKPASVLGHSAAGHASVQLASFGAEIAAKNEWQRLSRKYPQLLGGRTPVYASSDHDGHVMWRLEVSGFTDPKAATAFCDQLHSAGGSCSVHHS